MGDEKTNVTMDANKFYSQASKDLKSTIGGAKVDTAIIYNDTEDSVTHHGLVTAGQDARWCAPPQASATRLLYRASDPGDSPRTQKKLRMQSLAVLGLGQNNGGYTGQTLDCRWR